MIYFYASPKVNQAVEFPLSGRMVPEYGDNNLREMLEGNYRIVYEIDRIKKTVTVITVFEAHRLFYAVAT